MQWHFPKLKKTKKQIQLVGYLTPTLLVEIVHPSDKNLSINGYCDIMGQLGLLFVCFYVTKKLADVTNGRLQLTIKAKPQVFKDCHRASNQYFCVLIRYSGQYQFFKSQYYSFLNKNISMLHLVPFAIILQTILILQSPFQATK